MLGALVYAALLPLSAHFVDLFLLGLQVGREPSLGVRTGFTQWCMVLYRCLYFSDEFVDYLVKLCWCFNLCISAQPCPDLLSHLGPLYSLIGSS